MTEELSMIYDEFKESNQKTLNHLENELTKIRAGKASPAMLGGVMVEYYGSRCPYHHSSTLGKANAQ
jgi:ribosome recycling factor